MDITFLYGISRLGTATIYFFIGGLCSTLKSRMSAFASLKCYTLSMGLWDLLLSIYYLSPTVEIASIFLPLIYIAVPFTSLFFFYFTFCYTFPDKLEKSKKLILLGIIPLITAILAITSRWHNLFITIGDASCVYYTPLRELKETYHFWFYVHSIYSYLLVIAGMVILFLKLRNPTLQNKKECILVLIAAFVYIISNFFATFINPNFIFWISLFLKLLCMAIIYFTLYSDESEKIRYYGRVNLLETLPFPVFFLNSKDKIVYANSRAMEICPIVKKIARHQFYRNDIKKYFIKYPLGIDVKLLSNKNGSVDSVIQCKETGDIYFMQNETINYGKRNKILGNMVMLLTFASLEDIFANLENKAFKDSLCDVYNRNFLDLKKVEILQKNISPIAFVMCDINSLKYVNDTMGHASGDEYILLCSQIIKSSVRNTDYVFRMGGDEFLIVIPNADEKVAFKISEAIKEKLSKCFGVKGFVPSMAIGYAVAKSLPVNFDETIREADKNMYENKREIKSLNH